MDCTDVDSSTQHKPFHLLDLPSELLAIVSYAVVQPNPICLHPPATGEDNTINTKPGNSTMQAPSTTKETLWQSLLTPPPITRTTRLLRTAELKIYGENVFHGLNWISPRPHEWLRLIAATNKGSLVVS